MIDKAQRTAAKVVGVTYLLTVVLITAAFMKTYAPLMSNNASETARNIGEHEMAVRAYVACAVGYGIGLVVLLTALYVVLRPVNRGLALFATLSRLVYAIFWFVTIGYLLSALRIMHGGSSLEIFEAHQLAALASVQLGSSWDAYYIGLTFYGLSGAVFCYLWLRSGYVPWVLAGFGVWASLFEGICAFAFLIVPAFGKVVSVNWYEIPVVLFEIALSVWLLTKGLKAAETAKAVAAGK